MDYGYYREAFGGTKIPPEEFPFFVKKAEAFVRYLTGGKSDGLELDAIKDAVCAVCEAYAAEEARIRARDGNAQEIAAENNDGWSASYVAEGQEGQTREETLRRKAYQAAYPYLAFTGLLNRRVRHARQCGRDYL